MYARVKVQTSFDPLIKSISEKHGNNWHLVKAIIRAESSFNPKAHNTRGEDSRGLGQINAGTAISLGVTDLDSLFDPEINIETMNLLLDDLQKRYDGTLDIISAYNAGRPLKSNGWYDNSSYVLKVYSRFLAYSLLIA